MNAIEQLGDRLLTGKIVRKNVEEGKKLLWKAIEMGSNFAKSLLLSFEIEAFKTGENGPFLDTITNPLIGDDFYKENLKNAFTHDSEFPTIVGDWIDCDNNSVSLMELGFILIEVEAFEISLKCFRKSLELHSDSPKSILGIIICRVEEVFRDKSIDWEKVNDELKNLVKSIQSELKIFINFDKQKHEVENLKKQIKKLNLAKTYYSEDIKKEIEEKLNILMESIGNTYDLNTIVASPKFNLQLGWLARLGLLKDPADLSLEQRFDKVRAEGISIPIWMNVRN